MHNLAERFPEEAPTVRREHAGPKMIVFASKVDRLVETALASLRTSPVDDQAVDAATGALVQLQALAGSVLR